MVILEAMQACVPVVATRVGGIPDMLSAREAILVDSENPEALATNIRSTLTNPAQSAARAQNALQRLHSEFDTDTWLTRYENLYRAIQPGSAA